MIMEENEMQTFRASLRELLYRLAYARVRCKRMMIFA